MRLDATAFDHTHTLNPEPKTLQQAASEVEIAYELLVLRVIDLDKPDVITQVQLRGRNVERFRAGLVLKAHRLLYHSTPVSREIMKEKKKQVQPR